MHDAPPMIGSWYETDEGLTFKVIGLDDANGTIDIQYLNGRVETITPEIWSEMALIEVEPLEEWRASMDEFLAGRRRKQ